MTICLCAIATYYLRYFVEKAANEVDTVQGTKGNMTYQEPSEQNMLNHAGVGHRVPEQIVQGDKGKFKPQLHVFV